MSQTTLSPKKIFELAKEAGFDSHALDANSIIVRHSNGSWVGIEGNIFRFAELIEKAIKNSDQENLPKWKRCDHSGGRNVHMDWVECTDCGAIRTGNAGWKLAKNMWFPNAYVAKHYDQTGIMPDEVMP